MQRLHLASEHWISECAPPEFKDRFLSKVLLDMQYNVEWLCVCVCVLERGEKEKRAPRTGILINSSTSGGGRESIRSGQC